MKKIVWTFGLVIGTILCANMVIMINMMYNDPDFMSSEIVGYASMVVLFSLIFFGIRSYRDKQLDGVISFGKAFKTGFMIVLVASTMYVGVWLIYYYLFVPDFMEMYTKYALSHCSPGELAEKTEEMAMFNEWYKNPLFVILLTYAEVLPVGTVITLIIALILKRKEAKVSLS